MRTQRCCHLPCHEPLEKMHDFLYAVLWRNRLQQTNKHLGSGIQSHKTCFKQQNKTEHWLLLVLKQYECDGETDSSAAVNPEAEHTWNPKHQNVKFTFSSQFIYQLAHKNVLQRSHVAGLFFSPQDKKISVSVWGNEFRETFGSLMKSRQRRLITGNTPTDTL